MSTELTDIEKFNSIVEKHYKKQAYIWAQNVYQDIISNLFILSITSE